MSGTNKRETKRQIQEARRKKQQVRNILAFGGIGLAAIVIVVLIIIGSRGSSTSTGLMGEEVPITSSGHVDPNQDPGPYSSNPPAGGTHFEEDFEAGFFDEGDLASLPVYPEGYLVHNLEHGYVIFWYNCKASGSIDCEGLQQSIRTVMDQFDGVKLIAFPWSSLDVPLALTSWGRLLKLDAADEDVMAQFVRSNRNKAPEPNAP